MTLTWPIIMFHPPWPLVIGLGLGEWPIRSRAGPHAGILWKSSSISVGREGDMTSACSSWWERDVSLQQLEGTQWGQG